MAGKNPEPFVEIGCQELMAEGCSHNGVVEKEEINLGINYNVQRYLVLKSGCLYCFRHHNDSKASAQFSLNSYSLSNAPEKKGHAFKLIHKDPRKKTLVFAAASPREKDEWMEKIVEDCKQYCQTDEQCPYEEAPTMDADNLYLDPMSRPQYPLPDERCRKTQSLYIPRKTKTFDEPKIPREATADHVVNNWPPPALPRRTPLETVPSSPHWREMPNIKPARNPVHKPAPRPDPQLAPKPVPRPPLKPTPKRRSIQSSTIDGNRALPPLPTAQQPPLPTAQQPPLPTAQQPPLPLRRHSSEPKLDQRSAITAEAVAQELRKTMKRLGPTSEQQVNQDQLKETTLRRKEERPRNVRTRSEPDGKSSMRRDSVDPPFPAYSNILTKDLSWAAPKKMDMVGASMFLIGKKATPGTFVLRDSGSSESGKAISVWIGDKVKHYRIFYKQAGYSLIHDGPFFRTINDLMKYYHSNAFPKT